MLIRFNQLLLASLLLLIKCLATFSSSTSPPKSPKTADAFNIDGVNDLGEFQDLSNKYHPIDLSAGIPYLFPPKHVINALKHVAMNESSYKLYQYTDNRGEPRFRTAIAKLNTILLNRHINPDREVLVTVGAFQALNLIAKAYLNPGDEVIIFWPFFLSYDAIIRLVGGVPVFVPLRTHDGKPAKVSSDLTFNKKELENAFTNRTKMIWVNNPNNPTGKVFTREELTFIGQLAEKKDILILSDEAGQWYHYDGSKQLRMATLPGLWKRTLTMTSAGKMFTNTGWRLGWVIAPEELLWGLNVGLVNGVYSVATPLQLAFAMTLEVETRLLNTPASYFNFLTRESTKKRDLVLKALSDVGVEAIKPTASYFIIADFTKVMNKIDLSQINDPREGYKLTLWLLKEKNILLFPGEWFYAPAQKDQAKYRVRICFLKSDDYLKRFGKLLKSALA